MGCAARPPVFIDLRTGPLDGGVVTDNAVGSKVGEAETLQVLMIYGGGDDSVAAAAKNGGITKIATVDQKVFHIGGIFGKYTTIVTGE
jgi:hypothetical protein